MQSEQNFYEGKGHFATGERALFVFSENLSPPPVPSSYAPGVVVLTGFSEKFKILYFSDI